MGVSCLWYREGGQEWRVYGGGIHGKDLGVVKVMGASVRSEDL